MKTIIKIITVLHDMYYNYVALSSTLPASTIITAHRSLYNVYLHRYHTIAKISYIICIFLRRTYNRPCIGSHTDILCELSQFLRVLLYTSECLLYTNIEI